MKKNKSNYQSDDAEINAYREMVEKHYQRKEKEIIEFDNSSIAHAEVVTEYLFKYAIENKTDIKIFTGRLKANFYDKFLEQARTLLKTQKISIICEKQCEEGRFQALVGDDDNGEILNINASQDIGVSHFVLAGESAYRDEKSDALKTADASFNGRMRGSFLSVLFDEIKNKKSLLS